MQTEKVMKALYVRKLFLWPRFQMCVKEAVEERVTTPADVSIPLQSGSPRCCQMHPERMDRQPLAVRSVHGQLAGGRNQEADHQEICMFCLQLVELALPMSEAMTAIYGAIGELMAGCIKELRSSNKVCNVDLATYSSAPIKRQTCVVDCALTSLHLSWTPGDAAVLTAAV